MGNTYKKSQFFFFKIYILTYFYFKIHLNYKMFWSHFRLGSNSQNYSVTTTLFHVWKMAQHYLQQIITIKVSQKS